jgi:hypothetical protein
MQHKPRFNEECSGFFLYQRKQAKMQRVQDPNQSNVDRYSSPVTGLDWPRGFQAVKVPRFHDNGTAWW